jgi:hypothetical protein
LHNRQRQKTNEQFGREAAMLLEIEAEPAKRKQKEAGGDRKSSEYKAKSVVMNSSQPAE